MDISLPQERDLDEQMNRFVDPVCRNVGLPVGEIAECTSPIGVMVAEEYTPADLSEEADEQVYIGFDTEWTRHPGLKRTNDILAYGLVVIRGERWHECYVEPSSTTKRTGRLSFKRLIGDALQGALQAGVIAAWPKHVVVAFHFGRGDLAACSDFKVLRENLTAIKGTLASGSVPARFDIDEKSGIPVDALPMLPRTQQINAADQSGNQYRVSVRFLDTINITPADGASLEKIGQLIGFPKIELPDNHSPAEMRRFKDEQPDLFRAYLMRDALITARYAQRWARFCAAHLGIKGVPGTLGGAAVQYARMLWKARGLDRQGLLGLETRRSRRYSKATGRAFVVQTEVLSFARCLAEQASAAAYRGGWTETYRTGPICAGPGCMLRDVDLKSAYPTAMAALGVVDFDSARIVGPGSEDLFAADALGVAEVEFRTPPGIRFPGLGVATEAGLLFVRNGRTVVTSPEIAAARSIGVEVEVLKGVVLSWDRSTRPFLEFVVSLLNLRQRLKSEGRDTFESLMVKTIANSLYGKLGQGVHARSAYDPKTDRSRQLPPSPITQPILAAYTTGIVRAAIAEMLNSLPEGRTVVSVSTDGFLTDAELAEVGLQGPATNVLMEARARIAEATGEAPSLGHADLLEVKKEVLEVLAFRNRGIATTLVAGSSKTVTAKAGIKVPKGEDGNAFMARLFLDRDYDTRVERADLISLRDQMQHNADLVSISKSLRASLEPDMKRRLVSGQDVAIVHGEHARRTHLTTESKPYDTVDEALMERGLFRQWRERTRGCLKSEADWRSWQDHLAASHARRRGGGRLNVTAGGSAALAKRVFLRALVRNAWGVSRGGRTAEALAGTLTALGYATSTSDLKNASRSGNDPVEGSCAETPEVNLFLSAIAADFPGFEADRLFSAGGQPAAGGAFEMHSAALAAGERGRGLEGPAPYQAVAACVANLVGAE